FPTPRSGSAPLGLEYGADGSPYAADLSSGEISRVTPAGAVSRFVALPLVSQPVGLAFDTIGNLYESGVDSVVRKITPAGSASVFATDPHSFGFTSLAVTDDSGRPLELPVPEPRTAAVVIVAMLAVVR